MVRQRWVIRLFAVFSLVSSTSLLAVELTQASNQQILDELSRRLGGGSAPIPTPTASAAFICDSNSDLVISLTGRDTSSSLSIPTSGSNNCLSQTSVLTTHRSRIAVTSLIGVCDLNWDLHRISLNTSGLATEIGKTPMSGSTRCLDAASQMNSTFVSGKAELTSN